MKNDCIEKILKYEFKDKKLLHMALTHPSAVEENQADYQKLEFLGDSILDFLVAEHLYKNFADKKEGEFTKLRAAIVSKSALSQLVKERRLDKYLIIGHSQGVSDKMRSDMYESLVAAIYLDSGLHEARKFVSDTIIQKISLTEKDYKSSILEYAAKRGYKVYFDTKGEGLAHKMRFFSVVFVEGKEYGKGEGHSKKEAEQNAAQQALKTLADS